MANTKSAKKAIRQSEKKSLSNISVNKDIKERIKNLRKLILEGNKKQAEKELNIIQKKLDKAAKKNIIHKNTASRNKKRLSLSISKISKSK